MASFTLEGETCEYLKPGPGHSPDEARSWTYGNYPKVLAACLPEKRAPHRLSWPRTFATLVFHRARALRVRLERYQGLIASPFNRVGREPGIQ